MRKLIALVVSFLALSLAAPASAEVRMSFHSFDGETFGRYPHAFVVLEGTLASNGQRVKENYGFSAKSVTPAILTGPVKHMILIEKNKYIAKTNRHFTVTLTDAEYRRVVSEMIAWRDAPGNYYDLDKRNCIHFVGAMARIAGLKVSYPSSMIRKPKDWLNHVAKLNPKLRAKQVS